MPSPFWPVVKNRFGSAAPSRNTTSSPIRRALGSAPRPGGRPLTMARSTACWRSPKTGTPPKFGSARELHDPRDGSCADRDRHKAEEVVAFFARAFVNHLTARLLGRGFFDPVDNLDEEATPLRPQAHEALANHFAASGFQIKSVLRLLVSTSAYQSKRASGADFNDVLSGAKPKKLRGDEVYDSLVEAIELPNTQTKVEASTHETRFPPPSKVVPKVASDKLASCLSRSLA